jgi:hypothetical protein
MQVDAVSGAEHLLRAARDAALPDTEFERRVAAKNGVVARALRDGRLTLAEAEHLLYEPDLRDLLVQRRPGCEIAARILRTGCALATLEDRLLKWSPEVARLREERITFLIACSDRLLAPEALVAAFRRRPALAAEELELAAPLGDPRLLPVLLRTLLAETSAWPEAARAELRERAREAVSILTPRAAPSGSGGGEVDPSSWRRWWEREGCLAYPDPVDALPAEPLLLPAPVALLPEGGGAFTLDPPVPFYYRGRHFGRREVFYLRPRRTGTAGWPSRLARVAEALLAGGAVVPAEFEGACGLEGHRVHTVGPGEAIRASVPDPARSIAWLTCSECGQGGYVVYSPDPHALPL